MSCHVMWQLPSKNWWCFGGKFWPFKSNRQSRLGSRQLRARNEGRKGSAASTAVVLQWDITTPSGKAKRGKNKMISNGGSVVVTSRRRVTLDSANTTGSKTRSNVRSHLQQHLQLEGQSLSQRAVKEKKDTCTLYQGYTSFYVAAWLAWLAGLRARNCVVNDFVVSLTGSLSGSTIPRVDVKGISTPPAYTPTLVGLVFGVRVVIMALLSLPSLIPWVGIAAHDIRGRTRRNDSDSIASTSSCEALWVQHMNIHTALNVV